jgi:predicted nucleic acid-binding Zn ribbon protein
MACIWIVSSIPSAVNVSTSNDSDSMNLTNGTGQGPVCAEDFFFNNDTQTCRPECGEFLTGKPIFQRTAILIGFILTLLMMIVVLPVQRKTV